MTLFPKLPDWLTNFVALFKVAEIIGYMLLIASVILPFLGPWLPAILAEKSVGLLLGLLFVGMMLFVRHLCGVTCSEARNVVTELIQSKVNIYTSEQKSAISELLTETDKSARRSKLAAIALAVVITVTFVGPWIVKKIRITVPHNITLESAEYFQPTANKFRSDKAPFLSALRKSLTSEAGSDERYKIILIESAPFDSPTFQLKVTLDSESERFDLSGYVFRVIGETWEPIPSDLSQPGNVSLLLPRCTDGDRIFAIFRLTMKSDEVFPSDLRREIRMTIQKAE